MERSAIMAYKDKHEAFQYISFRNPRGAEVGTKVYYLDGSTQQRVEFHVVAEQVWRSDAGDRVMGLVWSGVCSVCKEGFFQPSPTHPKELNEQCSFCCSQRYDTYNVADTRVFNPNRIAKVVDYKGVKRRGRMENHVLEIKAMFGTESFVNIETLVNSAVDALPAPEEGKRDTRRHSVIRAVNSLSREKDGPLRISGGKVIFYE